MPYYRVRFKPVTLLFRQNKDKLIAQKDICMEALSKLVPLADTALEITSLVVPQAHWAKTGRNIASLLSDLSHCRSNVIGDHSKRYQ